MKYSYTGANTLQLPWSPKGLHLGAFVYRLSEACNHLNNNILSIIFAVLAALVIGASAHSTNTAATTPNETYGTFTGLSKLKKAPAVQPIAVVPTKTPILCDGNPVNTTSTEFTKCPTFYQNYTSQLNGAINEDIFNMYVGAPEANQEAQYYTSDTENVQIKDGNLVLSALNNPRNGYSYTSGRIDTKGKQDFLYGRIVVRATLPNNTGAWPAIWMLPTDQIHSSRQGSSAVDYYQRYLDNGEIDIAESVGIEPNTIYGIAHSLAYPRDGIDRNYYGTVNVPDSNTAYHEYGLDWTPNRLTFSVDGNVFFSINRKPNADYRSWPYDQKFYLVLNVALGGVWGGSNRQDFPKDGVDSASLPARMNISSIYYYPYSTDN